MTSTAITPHRVLGEGAAGGLRITCFTQAPKSRIPRHWHDNATVCVLLRGAARDQFLQRTIEFEPGAIICRPPSEGHSHEYGREAPVALVIEIPASRIRSDPDFRPLSELRFEAGAPTLGDSAQLMRCLRNPLTGEADIEEHCLLLLTAFIRKREEAFASDGVRRVRTFLDDSFTQKHSLGELARIADLSPTYLVNAFRKQYGCSIGQYRRRRCVALAIRQMWNTQSSLAEIAAETGFYDQSHYTNRLRKDIRLTPDQIRKIISADL